MATINFDEKRLIEDVFQVQQGRVLDFTNRTFEEFMKDVVSYNVYAKYPGLSKAKIIRAFIEDESDAYVGKLLAKLIKYMSDYGFVNDDNRSKVERLNELATKKLGRTKRVTTKPQKASIPTTASKIDYDALKSELQQLHQITSKQARGFAFEKLIVNIFSQFGLDPRASYRTEHDQIDGSFKLDGHTVLVEAKYREKIIPKDDLVLFSNKLSTKSYFTKGLFLTYSEVDKNAILEYNNHSSRFIIMTVAELYCMCEYHISLEDILRKKFRALDEEGLVFKHYNEL